MRRQIVKAPVYQQLNQVLRTLIHDGEFQIGDQFLTERQVCEQYDVSRATANKALSNLVVEGVLEFRKGVGTFVHGGVLGYDLRALVSFTEKALAAGKTPATQLLLLETVAAREAGVDLSENLQTRPDDEVYYVERLRLADETPVILERRYIVAGFCPGLSMAEFAGSLYAVWTDRYGLDVVGADQTIRAVSIRGREAELLDVRGGAAGLLVISTGFLSGGVPLWWEQTLYRGDAYEFHNRLGPIRTARPATGTLRDINAETRRGKKLNAEARRGRGAEGEGI